MTFARALADLPISQTPLAASSVVRLLRLAAPAALLTGLALGLGGCIIDTGANFKETRITEVQAIAGTPVRVQSRNGSIAVRRAQRSDVRISAELRATTPERLKAAVVRAQRDPAGALVIDTDWPDGGPRGAEGVTYDIQLPHADGITLESSNGSLVIDGLAGPASLTTTNGSVTVREHAGNLVARSTNGALVLESVTGSVDAQTSNGSATVAGAVAPLRVQTSNGNITLTLAPAFAGTLTARTTNGSLSLPPGASLDGKTSGTLTAGQGPQSSLTTSNGTITVTRP